MIGTHLIARRFNERLHFSGLNQTYNKKKYGIASDHNYKNWRSLQICLGISQDLFTDGLPSNSIKIQSKFKFKFKFNFNFNSIEIQIQLKFKFNRNSNPTEIRLIQNREGKRTAYNRREEKKREEKRREEKSRNEKTVIFT